ncbi:MAG: phage-related protein [Candidatus Omnitrophota bacterium]|jgi:phage-related protein
MLEKFGSKLAMPFCKLLKDNIDELSFQGKEGAVRVLYFFIKNQRIIFTNGFLKKAQKTPLKEIKLAITRKQIFVEGKYND